MKRSSIPIAQLVTVFALVAFSVAGCNPYGEKIRSKKKGEVFFKPPVTRDQAIRLGAFLDSVGFFDGTKRKSVQLLKKGPVYQLRFVVIESALGNAKAVEALKVVSGMAAREVLDRAPVELQLCDKRFKTLRTITLPKGFGDFGERLTFGKGELFIKKPVTVALGNKVGSVLLAAKFYDKKTRKSVQLIKEGEGYRLRFVAKKDPSPKTIAIFKALAVDVSMKALDGAKLQVEFCDTTFKLLRRLPVLELGKLSRHGKGELFSVRVSAEITKAVALALTKRKYFNATSSRAVQISKAGETFVVRFVVRKGAHTDPAVVTAFKQIFASVAPAFGGAPSRGELTNRFFEPLVALDLRR